MDGMSGVGTLPLVIKRGDTYTHTLSFFTDDAQTHPMPLDGREYLAQVRSSANSPVVLATITVDTTNAHTGVLVLRMDAEDTATIPQSGIWDLQETVSGVVTTILSGPAYLDLDVSRPVVM